MQDKAPHPELIADLVDANHILFHQGIVDAFGHVSVRHDQRPDRFLLARNMAPAQVAAEDIVEYDVATGEAVAADAPRPYLERYIHSEIYKARPDVMAVVHNHSPAVLPFGIVRGARLRPACHMCGFLGEGPPVFEIRDHAGAATDLLIRNRELGTALVRALGEERVVLMRGHGCTVVAPSLRLAVYRAVYTEVNAKLLLQSLPLGEVTYLTPEEAAAGHTTEGQVDRPWNLWKQLAREARLQQR
ncbi:class II aldolase/adducin family protein [Azohydromonas caseinilytica]|uniref:Class II aldolase/adducin family protein n=1 Tax=Azohydromonas caseinilytica TaxID=2728836 RepID=A0A848F7E8_9BURK|nr:class II aldolase/adducin family protein [Azohydromonas caseinilytica]NML16037.1 class II aldolase/adducin family protein [Azohydromonas caseinilytica]